MLSSEEQADMVGEGNEIEGNKQEGERESLAKEAHSALQRKEALRVCESDSHSKDETY